MALEPGPPTGSGEPETVPFENAAVAEEIDRDTHPAPGRGRGGSANPWEITGPAQQRKRAQSGAVGGGGRTLISSVLGRQRAPLS